MASIRSQMRRSVVYAVKIRCVGNKAENTYEVATGVEVKVEIEVKTAAEQDGQTVVLSMVLILLRATATARRGGGHQTAAKCRNPWSCRNKKELIQRARHVGHRQGTTTSWST